MSDLITVLVPSLISAASALGVSIISNRKTITLIDYRLQELEKKQDKHNSTIERTFKLEERMSVVETTIKDMKE